MYANIYDKFVKVSCLFASVSVIDRNVGCWFASVSVIDRNVGCWFASVSVIDRNVGCALIETNLLIYLRTEKRNVYG